MLFFANPIVQSSSTASPFLLWLRGFIFLTSTVASSLWSSDLLLWALSSLLLGSHGTSFISLYICNPSAEWKRLAYSLCPPSDWGWLICLHTHSTDGSLCSRGLGQAQGPVLGSVCHHFVTPAFLVGHTSFPLNICDFSSESFWVLIPRFLVKRWNHISQCKAGARHSRGCARGKSLPPVSGFALLIHTPSLCCMFTPSSHFPRRAHLKVRKLLLTLTFVLPEYYVESSHTSSILLKKGVI